MHFRVIQVWYLLATARMQIAAREIVLWTTPSEPPKALQASECSELLDPMRASCLILAQHQPGKFKDPRFPCLNKFIEKLLMVIKEL